MRFSAILIVGSLLGLAVTGTAEAVDSKAPPIMLVPQDSVPANPAPMKITNNLKLALRSGAEPTLYLVSAQIGDQYNQRYAPSELAAFSFSRAIKNWGSIAFSEQAKSILDAIKALNAGGFAQDAADVLAVKMTGTSVEFLMMVPNVTVTKNLEKAGFVKIPTSDSLVDEIYSVTPQEHMQANIAAARQQMKLMGSFSQIGPMRSWSEISLGFAAPNPRALASFVRYLRDTEKVNGTAELVGPVGKITWAAAVGEKAEIEAIEKAKNFCEKATKSKISCVDWGYLVRFKSN